MSSAILDENSSGDVLLLPPFHTSAPSLRLAVINALSFRVRHWLSGWILPLLAIATLVQACFLFSFYVPAHGGTDQNGYHVTARLIADEHRASFVPGSQFDFVGNMMVERPDGQVYAKYPLGYPLLAAMARFIGGANAVYLVNPICTVIACLFSFFLFRTLLAEFTSLLAVLWLSWNPLIVTYANDGNSHASTLLCIVVGAWGIISWLQTDRVWRGALGAFCFGYAATIRYSESLLLLPLLFAVVVQAFSQRTTKRGVVAAAIVFIPWLIPIGAQACFCWSAFGAPWKTGYSFCAEDSGFAWKYFVGDPSLQRPGNWETLLVQMNWMGLLMLWPVGVAGMVAMIGARREGIFISLWVVPSVALYLCYYWAPATQTSLSYLRFFIPIIPALILCALWLLERAFNRTHMAGVIALGFITAMGLSINLWNTLPPLETSFARREALAQVVRFVDTTIPQGSSIFIADENLSNCLDAAGGYSLYNLTLFKNSAFGNYDRVMEDPTRANEPDPRQRARMAMYWHLLGADGAAGDVIPKSNEQLKQAQDQIMAQLFKANNRVFFLLAPGQNKDMLPDEMMWSTRIVGSQVCYPNIQSTSRPVGWNASDRTALAQQHALTPSIWTLYSVTPLKS